jgi:hypothetical protein
MKKVKTRKLNIIEIYLASLFNPKLREILPFVNQKIELQSTTELIKAI